MATLDPLPEFSDISLTETSPDRTSLQSRASVSSLSQNKAKLPKKPSFNYDYDIFRLCQTYLREKNHHGLALIARQKGLPPFLRFKIWPVLLKYHPYVLKPSVQPDSRTSDSKDDSKEDELRARIKRDLNKYLTRLKYSRGASSDPIKEGEEISTQNNDANDNKEDTIETQIFDILEHSVFKFIAKWGKIIKYDSALTWIALGLAEWFPPINKTSWVLVGRDLSSTHNTSVKDLFVDYSNYIDNVPDLMDYLKELIDDETISNLSFHEVYERLVLVLLHCPANKLKNNQSNNDKNSTISLEKLSNIPVNGGSIEERVTLFIYIFRKLLPELSDYFSEEQILNKFGSNDDEWLIWWLKYCGSKVWSRLDRGKIWDLLIGFKFKSPGKNYNDTLGLDSNLLNKLGNNDNFWSLGFDNNNNNNSFMDLTSLQCPAEEEQTLGTVDIPFPVINPHIQLIFITLALLKSKENTLIELDQHEIRQYLSRLPTNSYNLTNKYQIFRQKIDKKREEESVRSSSRSSRSSTVIERNEVPSTPSTSATTSAAATPATAPFSTTTASVAPITTENLAAASVSSHGSMSPHPESNIITNDSIDNHSIDFMDNIIAEAGELWRKWLWTESQ